MIIEVDVHLTHRSRKIADIPAWRSGNGRATTSNGAWRTPYSVDYFARKHDISTEQARELMRKLGRDRNKLNEAAARLFRKSDP